MEGHRELPPEANTLVVQLMSHSRQETTTLMQQIIDRQEDDLARVCAEFELVRENITRACRAPVMHNPRYIESLLWPLGDEVYARVMRNKGGKGD